MRAPMLQATKVINSSAFHNNELMQRKKPIIEGIFPIVRLPSSLTLTRAHPNAFATADMIHR